MPSRREFVRIAAILGAAAIVGAVGGITDNRETPRGSAYERKRRERGEEPP